MPELASARVIVSGRVQGVFFRDFTRLKASEIGLVGFVRNLPDGTVEVVAEGERAKLKLFLKHLRQGPLGANVVGLEIKWMNYSGGYAGFNVSY